jgi:hypothetical protein
LSLAQDQTRISVPPIDQQIGFGSTAVSADTGYMDGAAPDIPADVSARTRSNRLLVR